MAIEDNYRSEILLDIEKVASGEYLHKRMVDVLPRMPVFMQDSLIEIKSKIKEINRASMTEVFNLEIYKFFGMLSMISEAPKPDDEEFAGACASGIAFYKLLTEPDFVYRLGYDAYRFGPYSLSDDIYSESARDIQPEIDETLVEFLMSTVGLDADIVALLQQSLNRMFKWTQYRTLTGSWHDTMAIFDRYLPYREDVQLEIKMPMQEWVMGTVASMRSNIQSYLTPIDTYTYLPAFPITSEDASEIPLVEAASSILNEIATGRKLMRELHWRQLEEIVAELLKSMGLKVKLTPRSRDGGRDVVAYGELIPGEPTLIAVEVKHKNVVPISDLRDALWANRHFPALFLATSGRFSAGVIREKTMQENHLRLILKDGVALKQWIDLYTMARREGIKRPLSL